MWSFSWKGFRLLAHDLWSLYIWMVLALWISLQKYYSLRSDGRSFMWANCWQLFQAKALLHLHYNFFDAHIFSILSILLLLLGCCSRYIFCGRICCKTYKLWRSHEKCSLLWLLLQRPLKMWTCLLKAISHSSFGPNSSDFKFDGFNSSRQSSNCNHAYSFLCHFHSCLNQT